MELTKVMSTTAPAPGGAYSHAAVWGSLISTAGQVGIDPATGEVPADVAGQTRQALANIAAVLREMGAGLGDIMKTTCFLADLDDFAEFDAAYRDVFDESPPARSTVGVRLAPAYAVEIEAVAIRPER